MPRLDVVNVIWPPTACAAEAPGAPELLRLGRARTRLVLLSILMDAQNIQNSKRGDAGGLSAGNAIDPADRLLHQIQLAIKQMVHSSNADAVLHVPWRQMAVKQEAISRYLVFRTAQASEWPPR